MAELTMPRLTDSMSEGTVVAWLKPDGAPVAAGDEVVDIETDKATMTVEVEADGVLRRLVAEGDVIAVGEPIATIDPAGAARPGPATPKGSRGVSPIARRAASRLGVELERLVGSGPRGRVMKADVLALVAGASESPPAAAVETDASRAVELTSPQRTIATRMVEAKSTVPDFWASVEVEMSAVVELRERLRALSESPPSVNDLLVRAVAVALRRHPRANGIFRGDRLELHDRVDIGLAVAAEETLLVPVVRDADRLGLAELAAETRRLAAAVRERTITPAELDGATFTVSNLGMMGVDSFAGIVDAPRVAILCVGAVAERPVVRAGELVAAPTAVLTLVSDHRILYGADAAAFLGELRELLEEPLAALL